MHESFSLLRSLHDTSLGLSPSPPHILHAMELWTTLRIRSPFYLVFIFPLNILPHRLSSAFMVPIRTIRAPPPPDAATKAHAPPPSPHTAVPPSPKSPPVADDVISAQGTGQTGRVTAPALHACGKGRAWRCPISPSGVPEGALYGPSAVTSPLRRRRTTFTERNCHFLNAPAASLPARGHLTACLAAGTPRPGPPQNLPRVLERPARACPPDPPFLAGNFLPGSRPLNAPGAPARAWCPFRPEIFHPRRAAQART